MSRFDECLSLVVGAEGGYSNDESDHGGATDHGVTQKVYDEWRSGRGLASAPVAGISSGEVRALYSDLYWERGRCDFLPAPLDYVHFDGCVNHGVGQAAKFLQRALQVTADGDVGPATLQAVKEESDAVQIDQIVMLILALRDDFYEQLASHDLTQLRFLVGWHNRIDLVRKRAGAWGRL
jgi:lysozyme family protein